MSRNDQYSYGRKKEREIILVLKEAGYETHLSPGSRTACDIFAQKKHRKYCIQAKSTRGIDHPAITSEEKRRLKITATKRGAIPVVATNCRTEIEFRYARTNKILKIV